MVAIIVAIALIGASARAAVLPADAVTGLNTWRTEVGESPVSTSPVPAWNTGCEHPSRSASR